MCTARVLFIALCAGALLGGAATRSWAAESNEGGGLGNTAAAIHQRVLFQAPCTKVYDALTQSARFDAMTRLSDAVSLVTAPGAKATEIDAQVGGAFTLFGGYITGRNLEMLAGKRLVQAWRAGSWRPGEYSIVRFELADEPTGCNLTFDHTGFPDSQGQSLLHGWGVHYWTPLKKLLSGA
ncbi:MAG TPA: SRPBCC domain-containing protein [Steroidobacteraceae bacterium]|jgi:activator of HSP90 ATPase